MRSRLFDFPNPVNETSARLVAAGVVAQGVAYLVFRQWWLLVPLAYGFLARVLSGPRFSPLGQFVTRVVTPRLHVAAPVRRRPAEAVRSGSRAGVQRRCAASPLRVGSASVARRADQLCLVLAATLESAFAFCLGCMVFNRLMRLGLIPADVCEDCNDITRRFATASS